MKHHSLKGGSGYATSALGVMLFGTIAMLLTASYPPSGYILMLAVLVALAGIGQRWHRHMQRQRRRDAESPEWDI